MHLHELFYYYYCLLLNEIGYNERSILKMANCTIAKTIKQWIETTLFSPFECKNVSFLWHTRIDLYSLEINIFGSKVIHIQNNTHNSNHSQLQLNAERRQSRFRFHWIPLCKLLNNNNNIQCCCVLASTQSKE